MNENCVFVRYNADERYCSRFGKHVLTLLGYAPPILEEDVFLAVCSVFRDFDAVLC